MRYQSSHVPSPWSWWSLTTGTIPFSRPPRLVLSPPPDPSGDPLVLGCRLVVRDVDAVLEPHAFEHVGDELVAERSAKYARARVLRRVSAAVGGNEGSYRGRTACVGRPPGGARRGAGAWRASGRDPRGIPGAFAPWCSSAPHGDVFTPQAAPRRGWGGALTVRMRSLFCGVLAAG